jgi:hypothetical protein
MLGPASSATDDFNPSFPIAVGTVVMIFGWAHHLRQPRHTRAPVNDLLYVTAVCAVFIAFGVWRLLL